MNLESEANIQGEFYHQCRLIWLPVTLEFTTAVGRLDVAVLNKLKTGIVAVVECKKTGADSKKSSDAQMIRYSSLGISIYHLNAFNEAAALAALIKTRHCDDVGFIPPLEIPKDRVARIRYAPARR